MPLPVLAPAGKLSPSVDSQCRGNNHLGNRWTVASGGNDDLSPGQVALEVIRQDRREEDCGWSESHES